MILVTIFMPFLISSINKGTRISLKIITVLSYGCALIRFPLLHNSTTLYMTIGKGQDAQLEGVQGWGLSCFVYSSIWLYLLTWFDHPQEKIDFSTWKNRSLNWNQPQTIGNTSGCLENPRLVENGIYYSSSKPQSRVLVHNISSNCSIMIKHI